MASDYIKQFKQAFSPLSTQSQESKDKRKKEWRRLDGNGSNQVSLAELDGWILVVLKDLYGDDEGDTIFKMFRPSYIRAYEDANDIAEGNDDFITFREFRVACVYLSAYGSLYNAFISIDGGCPEITKDDDQRIDLEEFKKAADALKKDTPFSCFSDEMDGKEEELFHTINTEGDLILFRELCHYAKENEIRSDSDLGRLLSLGEEDTNDDFDDSSGGDGGGGGGGGGSDEDGEPRSAAASPAPQARSDAGSPVPQAATATRSNADIANIADLTDKNKKLTDQNLKLTDQLKNFNKILDKLTAKLAEQQKAMAKQASTPRYEQKRALNDDDVALKEKLVNAEKRIANYKKSNRDLQKQLLSQAEYEDVIKVVDKLKDSQLQVKRLQKEAHNRKLEIDDLRKQLLRKVQSDDNLPETLEKCQIEMNRAIAQNKKYQKQIYQQEQTSRKVQAHMARLKDQNLTLKSKLNKGVKKGEIFQNVDNQTYAKINALEREIESQKNKLKEKNMEIAALTSPVIKPRRRMGRTTGRPQQLESLRSTHGSLGTA